MAEVRVFGKTTHGEVVRELRLAHAGMSLSILTHGARIHWFSVAGSPNLLLNAPDMATYEGEALFHNAIVAPVVNRLGDASWNDGRRRHVFEQSPEGPFCLHSGSTGTQNRVWSIEDTSISHARLSIDLQEGLGGFPGNRRITVIYRLADENSLCIQLFAQTDSATPMNPAFHGYWNLDGAPTWQGHRLAVAAERYLPTGTDSLPTGDVVGVARTGFDYCTARTPDASLDHCFCLAPGELPAATLEGVSGRKLALTTDAPGLQVFCGVASGIALEPQLWPDALRNRHFPDIVLKPGQVFSQKNIIKISN